MELWIRSQDKEMLKRVNTALYLKQGLSNYAKGDVIFIVGGGDELGEYETKERALEVLDEIQNMMKNKYIVEFYDRSNNREQLKLTEWYGTKYKGEFIPQPDYIKIEPINTNILIYEMPKE